MEQDNNETDSAIEFSPSPKGPLSFVAKRNSLLTFLLIPIVVNILFYFVTNKFSVASVLILQLLIVLIFAPIILWVKHYLKKTRISITNSGISSPIFKGENKFYEWESISDISIDNIGKAHFLKFTLNDSRVNQHNRLKDKSLSFPLSAFYPEEQEKIVDAVNNYWHKAFTNANQPVIPYVNSIKEERELIDKLKALAPIPWISYGLMVVNVIVWAVIAYKSHNFFDASPRLLLAWGGNAASEVYRGEWWRLISSSFLHSSFIDLSLDMVGLYVIGITAERIYSRYLFLITFIGSGLVGNALCLYFGAQQGVVVGSSGAILGVAGALLIGVYQHQNQLPKGYWKETLSNLVPVFVIFIALYKQGITGHIAGLAFGSALALYLPTQFEMDNFRKSFIRAGIVSAVAAFFITSTLVHYVPSARVDVKQLVEARANFVTTTKQLLDLTKLLLKDEQDVKAGRMTEIEQDVRSRKFFAPKFKKIYENYSNYPLLGSDAIYPLENEYKKLTKLLLESLEMESVINPVTNKPEPIDAKRMADIEKESKEVTSNIKSIQNSLTAKKIKLVGYE